MSLNGALFIVATRARLMVRKCAMQSTGMIAVNHGSATVTAALQNSDAFADLSLSCFNSPSTCVVSGPLTQIQSFKEYLDAEVRCKNTLLSVPFGYHSPAMTPLLDDLTAVAKRITLSAPIIPVVSNVLGAVVMPGNDTVFSPEYFSRHCREPVQFDKGVRMLAANSTISPVDVWMEIGPHTSTLPMLRSNPVLSKESLFLGSLKRHQEPWATLATSLSQLYSFGANLHWREVFAHINSVSCVSLPSYPFSKDKFWIAFKEGEIVSNAGRVEENPQNSMLHRWVQYPSQENGCVAVFETPISKLAKSILGHTVGGIPLCPASVYIEQVLAGIDLATQHLCMEFGDRHAILRKIQFSKPLVYDKAVNRVVITTITVTDGSGTFSVGSRVDSSSEEIHVQGEYRLQSTSRTSNKFAYTLPVVMRHMAAVRRAANDLFPEVFSTRTVYEVIFPRVVEYAKEYHTIRCLTVDSSGMEGCADVRLPPNYDRSKFVVHPVFTDTLLHVAGFVANLKGQIDDAYICSEVGTVNIIPQLINNDSSYTVYCNSAFLPEDNVMVAEAYAVENADHGRIVAHMKGMHFRRVRLDRLRKGLGHAAGKFPPPLKSRAEPSVPSSPGGRPDRDGRNSATSADLSCDISRRIVGLVLETCGLGAIDLDVQTDLVTLGIDSLMSIELSGRLEQAFPNANLSAHLLTYCKSVADIIQEVSTASKYSRGSDEGTYSTHSSALSSPRTLVMDDRFSDSAFLTVNDEPDVKLVLASALGLDVCDIQDDLDLESLGLDSLTSIETLHALKTEFGLKLPENFFTSFPTIRAVQSYLSSRRSTSEKLKFGSDLLTNAFEDKKADFSHLIRALQLDKCIVPIQNSKSSRLPLFLIHDGSGLVHYYDRLLQIDRPIWGINNPRFTAAEPWNSIIHMAEAYADTIARETSGPVILGGKFYIRTIVQSAHLINTGWSFGGVVAYEISVQLAKKGVEVRGILLIDSPCPINHVPLPDAVVDSVLALEGRRSDSDLGRLVKAQFFLNSRMLGQYDPPKNDRRCPTLVLLRSKEGYDPPNISDVPTWLVDRNDPKVASAEWEMIAGEPIKVLDIPGHHFQPFEKANVRCIYPFPFR